MDLQEKLVASYMAQTSTSEDSKRMAKLRSTAIETFEQQGFPTKKMEDWKYTPLSKLVKTDFTVFPKKSKNVTLTDVQRFILHDVDTYKIVFVDGVYSSFLSETTHEGMDVPKDVGFVTDVTEEAWFHPGTKGRANERIRIKSGCLTGRREIVL